MKIKPCFKSLLPYIVAVSVTLSSVPIIAAADGYESDYTDNSEYVSVSAPIGVSAASAILIDADSGTVLYEKDAHTRRPMASTTKITTALVALENGNLSDTVTIPKEAVGVEGSSIYLYEKEKLTLEQLIYALMLQSANDAATAIAIHIAGSVENFASMMNDKAYDLGLTDTSYENPHGLDSENHYTTASDLAAITAKALQNDTFRKIVSTYKTTIPMNGGGVRLLINHNRLLRSYDGAIGVKTGYTKRCGRCLVTAAERDGVTLVAVTLNASDDWNDHKRMLDYGFTQLESILLSEESISGCVDVVGGSAEKVKYTGDGQLRVTLPKKEHDVRCVTELFRFYYAPIEKGEVLGRTVYYDGDTEIASIPLICSETVEKRQEEHGFIAWIKSIFGK